jgi:lipopolysaccharide/colanic/teichoic acid biosynthesis glycosyltransferase
MQNEDAVFILSAGDVEALGRRPYWRIKRIMDIVGAACLLVVAMPFAVLIAMLVATDIGRPAIFWQERPGVGGRPFKLFKFRTMSDAHDTQGGHIPEDERLSAVGRFLRRTRLDELPQLYNILIGEMSLVGPRPLLPADQCPAYAARLLVRPGLTGWAQIIGGRNISAADKAALDVWYGHNASLALDLKILLRTIPIIFFGERVNAKIVHRTWDELRQAGICSSSPLLERERFVLSIGRAGPAEHAA